MRIDEAKKEIKALQTFILMLENYIPETYEQEVFKLYVEIESVTAVSNLLNEKGYRIGARKIIGTDVSSLIRTKSTDKMHELAQNFLRKNVKRSQRTGSF